jgi:trimethylamine--corrinoid protein Co-methyltransferase
VEQGLPGGFLNVLSDSDVERIDSASLELLEQHGVCSESDLITGIFRKAGARVDTQSHTIRVSGDMVGAALKSAPKSFLFYGRKPEMDLQLEPGHVYFGMGGSPEPFFYDYDLGAPRPPTMCDMVACTRLGEALEHVDFVMCLCSAGDMPQDSQHYYEYDVLLRNTTKPLVCSAPGRRYAAHLLEMAAAASGGEEALRRRPSVAFFAQPVSPMKVGRYSEGMFEAAAFGVPVLSSPGPMMGATSPASLAGTLAQINAEALFGIVLSQLIRPGSPVFYAPHTGVMDMVTAQCTYGSPEQALARAAVAQMGRFYNLPTFGLGGGVEAKLPDGEAVAQATMGMLLNALSGLTLTQTLGTLASGLYGSAEMLVICDEIVHMLERVLGGISVTDETLALDAIKGVGHGGHFLDHEHTVRLFRQELFFPALFRRQTLERWQKDGQKSITQVSHERVEDVLAKAGPVPLLPGADVALERALAAALGEAGEG